MTPEGRPCAVSSGAVRGLGPAAHRVAHLASLQRLGEVTCGIEALPQPLLTPIGLAWGCVTADPALPLQDPVVDCPGLVTTLAWRGRGPRWCLVLECFLRHGSPPCSSYCRPPDNRLVSRHLGFAGPVSPNVRSLGGIVAYRVDRESSCSDMGADKFARIGASRPGRCTSPGGITDTSVLWRPRSGAGMVLSGPLAAQRHRQIRAQPPLWRRSRQSLRHNRARPRFWQSASG